MSNMNHYRLNSLIKQVNIFIDKQNVAILNEAQSLLDEICEMSGLLANGQKNCDIKLLKLGFEKAKSIDYFNKCKSRNNDLLLIEANSFYDDYKKFHFDTLNALSNVNIDEIRLLLNKAKKNIINQNISTKCIN